MDMNISQFAALFSGKSMIDLSQTMEMDMPVWPTHPHFYRSEAEHYDKGDGAFLNQLVMGEHNGTHVDAPVHFIRGGKFIDEISPSLFCGRGVKIQAHGLPPCGLVTKTMITDWEAKHGPILAGDIVMFDINYARHWGVKPHYKAFLSDWPGLSGEGANYLAERKVKAVGTDAMALDAFGQAESPAHEALLGTGVLIIENLCNLDKIQDFCLFIGLPLKVKGGSGSPIRAVALV